MPISEWQPNSLPQAEALARSEREILYGGARGGGKTAAGIAWIGEPEYIEKPEYSSLVVRKNSKDLRDWLNRTKRFYDDNIEIKGNGSLIEWKKGGKTYVGHLKDERSLESLLGIEFQKILIEELTQVKTEDFYLQLLGSCRSTIGLPSQVFATTNPGGIGHAWVKKRFCDCAKNKTFYDSAGLTRIYIPAKVYDNVNLCKDDPAYIQYLESLPHKLKEAWLNGNWDIFAGQFFDEFGIHLREEPFYIQPHESNIYGSLDYGETNATSFGLWHLDKEGVSHRLFTYYNKNQNAATYAREIMDRIKSFTYTSGVLPKVVFADPSIFIKRRMDDTYSKSVADIFIDHGFTTITQANNERINGWRVMRDMMRANTTGVFNLRYFHGQNDEFEEYIPTLMHDDRRPEDVDKGGEDHVGDEARYYCVAAMGLKTIRVQNASGRHSFERARLNFKLAEKSMEINCSDTGY